MVVEVSTTGPCPDDVLRLIAWYPDGELSSAERGRVEAHAAECRECRDEIEMLQRSDSAAGDDAELESIPATEGVYAGVLARIEEHAIPESGENEAAKVQRLHQGRRRPSQFAAALAAGLTALAVGVGIGTTLDDGRLPSADAGIRYQSAAEPVDVAVAPDAHAVDVIFRSDATADQITNALRALSARVVSGPTRLGVFRLALRSDGDPVAAVEVLRARGSGVATFAELVQPRP